MTLFLTHKCLAMAIFYFIDLILDFKPFNSKLNYIKYEDKLFFQMGWIYIMLGVQESPYFIPNSCMITHWWKNQIFFNIWFLFKRKYCTLMDQSFFTPFSLPIASINIKHHRQPQTRNPSSSQTLVLAKIFKKVGKIEFQIAAGFNPFQPSSLAQKVPRSHNHLLLEAKASQIALPNSHRFANFLNFDFDIPCIANHFHVFICVQEVY